MAMRQDEEIKKLVESKKKTLQEKLKEILGMMSFFFWGCVCFCSVMAADRVSLGFIYDAKDPVALVERTKGAINQVAPTCLNLTKDGNLDFSYEVTKEFVATMHEKGIVVTPFLSNHWVRSKARAALENKETVIKQILEIVSEYQLDGINVDLENLTPADRDNFTEFVKRLREELPKEKILSVCVAANPEGKETGWQGSYDYEKLGIYADYLFIMTYDEHSQGGAEGPVASLPFVEKSIQYALKYVPKDKIVMGIPLFGRYWKEGAMSGGEAVVIGNIPYLVKSTNGMIQYQENIGEPELNFQIEEGQTIRINGKVLEAGNYTVWFENKESIKAKLALVNQYDLLGAGVWALGQEKVEIWEEYKGLLNQIPYVNEEEQKEIRQREQYEALVMDISKLEVPERFQMKKILESVFVEMEKEEKETKKGKEESKIKQEPKRNTFLRAQEGKKWNEWKKRIEKEKRKGAETISKVKKCFMRRKIV